jgi:PAS domain S-box-containing protein
VKLKKQNPSALDRSGCILTAPVPRQDILSRAGVGGSASGPGALTGLLTYRPLGTRRAGREEVAAYGQVATNPAEIRYRRLFEAATDGLVVVDPETRRITDANPAILQLLGYPRDEFLGKELFEIGLFRDEQTALDAFQQLREYRRLRYDHFSLRDRDGGVRKVELVASAHDEDGGAVIQLNVRDVTERKRTEEALRRSEARFQAIIAHATAGIAELDLTGKLTLVNQRFCEIVGRAVAELHGVHIHDITHPDDRAGVHACLRQAAAGRTDLRREKRYVRPDGRNVWVSSSVAAITSEQGIPCRYVEILEDIHDHKRRPCARQPTSARVADETDST